LMRGVPKNEGRHEEPSRKQAKHHHLGEMLQQTSGEW
jgi:hypothetical protein